MANMWVKKSIADLKVEAARVTEEHADYLGLLPGDPIMSRELIYYDTTDRPVMAGVSHYRADQVRYSVRVPLQRDGQALTSITESLEVRAAKQRKRPPGQR